MMLNAACDYFKGMLQSNMKEVREGEISFRSMDEEAVSSLVDYFYGEEITISWDKVADYLDAAETFQLLELKVKIEEYMCQYVTPDNCLQMLEYANLYYLDQLKSKAKETTQHHFFKACSSKNFEHFDCAKIVDLINNEDLALVASGEKLKLCIRWICFDEEERKHLFGELIEHIKLRKCSSSFLKYVLDTYSDRFITQVSVYAKISAAMSVGINPVNMAMGGRNAIMLLGGYTDENNCPPNKKFYKIDFDKKFVEEKGELPDEMATFFPARCLTPMGVISIGGMTDMKTGRATTDCFLFDLDVEELSLLPPVPIRMAGAIATAIGMKVFVTDGRNMGCLDLNTRRWRKCAAVLKPFDSSRFNMPSSVCSIGHEIFVFSHNDAAGAAVAGAAAVAAAGAAAAVPGAGAGGDNQVLQCYDSRKDEWSLRAPPPSCTRGGYAVSVDKQLYIVGGHHKLCIAYKPASDKWQTDLNKPSVFHIHGGVCNMNGAIVLCGGKGRNAIEIYNPAKNKWKMCSLKMPQMLTCSDCLKV